MQCTPREVGISSTAQHSLCWADLIYSSCQACPLFSLFLG
jgi:hypothetical protein